MGLRHISSMSIGEVGLGGGDVMTLQVVDASHEMFADIPRLLLHDLVVFCLENLVDMAWAFATDEVSAHDLLAAIARAAWCRSTNSTRRSYAVEAFAKLGFQRPYSSLHGIRSFDTNGQLCSQDLTNTG